LKTFADDANITAGLNCSPHHSTNFLLLNFHSSV